jgi:hypothetical protein
VHAAPVDKAAGSRLPSRSAALLDGILSENSPGGGRVLWIPAGRAGRYRLWDRVSELPRAEFNGADGVVAAPATLVPTRRLRGALLGWLGRLLRTPSGTTWLIPDGTSAEQYGPRRADLLLVWADNAALDEDRVRSIWPDATVRPLGPALYLLEGVTSPRQPDPAAPVAGPGCPRKLAEYLLAAARTANDRRKEVAALTDLGLIELHESHPGPAATLLGEALDGVRTLGDPTLECDVRVNLGLAITLAGEPRRAIPVLEEALAGARATGNRYAEKLALERLGVAHAHLSDPKKAADFFEQSLAVAVSVGDRGHQAELLWHLAIQRAETGQHDWTQSHARAAVELLTETGDPQAGVFAAYLQRFRTAVAPAVDSRSDIGAPPSDEPWGGSIVIGPGSPSPHNLSTAAAGPSLLKMAFRAAKSAGRFVGSGLRTVPEADLQRRLRTCASCEYHTGLRCRLCGCFTNAKARLPHEECPAGKWDRQPAADLSGRGLAANAGTGSGGVAGQIIKK